MIQNTQQKRRVLFLTLAAILCVGLLPHAGKAQAALINLTTYSGTPGSTVGVMGTEFAPNENVNIHFPAQAGASTSATLSGALSTLSLSVPKVPAGNYTVTANGSSNVATANFYVAGFYPKATPSSWYVAPGQMLSFTGSNFAPGEHVTVSGDANFTATADGSGNFSSGSMTVPYSWQNTTKHFTVSGDASAYSISIAIKAGSFYPNIEPSSYYVAMGQGMNVTGSGFAPGEQVTLTVGGTDAGTQTANGTGGVTFTMSAPNSAGSVGITAMGLSSGKSSMRTITVH